MLLTQLASHVPSFRAPNIASFRVSAGKIYTKEVHKQRYWELQLPPAFQDFQQCVFLTNKQFPAV